jgi:hypothetical protein
MAMAVNPSEIAQEAYDTNTVRGLLGKLSDEITNIQAVFGDLVDDISPLLTAEISEGEIASLGAQDSPGHSEIYMDLDDQINRIIRFNKKIRTTRERVQI